MASVFVTCDIKEQGAQLIQDGSGSSVRGGVELLLKNDLCFGDEEVTPPPDAVDAGVPGLYICDSVKTLTPSSSLISLCCIHIIVIGPLVQEGLTLLVNYPFDTLDISIESQTVDVRKAYKRMALKYRKCASSHINIVYKMIELFFTFPSALLM